MTAKFEIWAVQVFVDKAWKTISITSYDEDARFMYDALLGPGLLYDGPSRLVRYTVPDLEYIATLGTDFEVVEAVGKT